jgi:hypothetical protein
LVVNQVVPTVFAPSERDALAALEEPTEQDPASLALGAGIRRAAREQVQSQSLERLAELGVPLLQLPFLVEGASSMPAISKLVDALVPSASSA